MTKYIITHNYGQVPNQIEGHTDDGRHFYFRGRHGGWSLGFGATEDEAVENQDFSGNHSKAGWFELDEWEQFFWTVIADYVEVDK